MDNWLKRTVVGIAAALALGGSIAAYSQAEAHFHGGPPSAEDVAAHEAGFLAHVGKELDLDAAQKTKLQALGDLLRKDHEALTQGDPHSKMAELIAGNTFDRASAQAIVDDKLGSVKNNAPALIAATGDFFDSLRADQQQKVRDFMTKHHDHMASHMPPPGPAPTN